MVNLEDLRKNSYRVVILPNKAAQTLHEYLHLQVDGAECNTPYHINPGLRSRNRGLIGKGSPAEIKTTIVGCFKRFGMYVGDDASKLQSYLAACGIGVDCSGFVAWILNDVTKETFKKPLAKCLKFPGVRRRVASKIRPIENISAHLITSHLNTVKISNLGQVKPGDLMRVVDGLHVLIITEVGLNKDGETRYFQYAQSSCRYGIESGIRTGYCVVKNPKKSLLNQEWFDNYKKNIVKEMIKEGGEDSRIVRLRVLEQRSDS